MRTSATISSAVRAWAGPAASRQTSAVAVANPTRSPIDAPAFPNPIVPEMRYGLIFSCPSCSRGCRAPPNLALLSSNDGSTKALLARCGAAIDDPLRSSWAAPWKLAPNRGVGLCSPLLGRYAWACLRYCSGPVLSQLAGIHRVRTRISREIGRIWPLARIRPPSVLSRLAKGQHPLRGREHGGQALDRLIEPGSEIPIREEVHSQQGDQVRQRPGEAGLELEVLEQQHRDQGGPDLHLQGIGAGPHKGLDLQVLLQGLEEQLDLPAVLVDGGDGRSPEGQVVGQEHEGGILLRGVDLDPPQPMRTRGLGLGPRQADHLIAADLAALRHPAALDHLVDGGVLQPGHEEDPVSRQPAEPGVVYVAAVEDQVRPRIEAQVARDPHVMPPA